jgi:carboxynorspermidine decarboxylase
MHNFYQQVQPPAFLIDQARLERNLKLIDQVQEATGVKVILALKGFANWPLFPLVYQYLHGATASSLNEARLIYEEMGTKAHTYSPAYFPDDFANLMQYSSHLTFNSLSQLEKYTEAVQGVNDLSVGLRVNPEYSEVETDLYNPAVPGSRLGMLATQLPAQLPDLVEGLHVHTLCESSAQATGQLIEALEDKFSAYLPQLKWVNLGGGHLMTRKGYNLEYLIQVLKAFKERHPHLEVIMEPGSAIAWETGELVSTVLDIVESGGLKTAIVDVSFTAHMPDTLEMPYRPTILGADKEGKGVYQYRIGGVSCLAGDFMDVYGFEKELQVGDRIVFWDMIHYTMVKTTMFNGVQHPAIFLTDSRLPDQPPKLLRKFTYEDFKNRLG